MRFEPDAAFAERWDKKDELGHYRKEFVFSDPNLIYLDGNSLGRLTLKSAQQVKDVVEKGWGEDLIRRWNKGWYEAPSRVGDKIATLIGAAPEQVIVADSTSINLFKLVMAALAMRPDRRVVISDTLNFPSDLYILQGCIQLMGGDHQLRLVSSGDGIQIEEDSFLEAIDEGTALLTFSHVAFKSGYAFDVKKIADRVHHAGAMILVDLSHSVGVLPIELDSWGVDLAVGCTYKYLNGGPGSPAFLYVRKEIQRQALSPIWGWFGQHKPFDFDLEYRAADSIRRFLVGTPPILSLLAIEPALDIIREAGIDRIRKKSTDLTSYLIYLIQEELVTLGFKLGSPIDPEKRGSHVSLRHPEGYRINRALIEEMSLLPDFREPDLIRLGLAPLYTSFLDVWEAVQRIKKVVIEGRYRKYSKERFGVT
ncbi:MAG: kynureninase [Chloroflexi bacterium RBG_16_48_8]|nr:MAG: kynureninase [Chloroflexi bacterium RBG_16_48_8]